jgi:L-rhamnose mutarotase
MHGIKAIIHAGGAESSVEFSLEEAISQYHGKPWAELSEAEQDAALRDYALSLFQRQSGVSDNLRVELKDGSFSKMHHRDV